MSEAPTPNEAGGWETLAREAACRLESGGDVSDIQQFLTFRLDGAFYAIPVERVNSPIPVAIPGNCKNETGSSLDRPTGSHSRRRSLSAPDGSA